ncbi:MAG: PAS domain-containing protein, partial [Candidatus Omnitrophota bacterium]
MEKTVRLLIVEGNDDHFDLLIRELKAHKIEFSPRRAQTKQEFLSGLAEFLPDAVISDFFLPGFDGMTAFRICRDFDPTIPFIIVTGSMNEETAVECMKAGVTDYIIKEHVGHIGPALRAAIHRKWALVEKTIAEEKLAEKEKFLENLVDSLPGVTYQCLNAPDWSMQYVSESVNELTGYSAKDFFGHPPVSYNELIHPEDRDRVWKEVQEAVKARGLFEIFYRIRTAQGQEKWVWD